MIIQYSENNENRIEWQHRRGGEWRTAELHELIEAYERATEPGDLISRKEAIRMYCKSGCGCEPSECGLTYEQDGTEECEVGRFLKSVPSVAGDLIGRKQAIKAIEDLQDCYNGFSDTYDKACIIGVLEELPSAEKTGKWIVQFADNGWKDHICSECGFRHNTDIHIFLDWRYCPSCGAVMEEEKGQWEI